MSYSPRRGNQPSDERTVAHSTWVTKVQVSRASEKTIRALMRMEVRGGRGERDAHEPLGRGPGGGRPAGRPT